MAQQYREWHQAMGEGQVQTVYRQFQSRNLHAFYCKEGEGQQTDLNEVVRKAESVLASLFESHRGLAVKITLAQQELEVMAEGDRIATAVLGIVRNVLKTMPQCRVLSLYTQRVDFTYRSVVDDDQYRYGACASLSIAAGGLNGSCNTRNKTTRKDPEFRAAYNIIKEYRGSVRRHRVPGQGVTITVYLPLLNPDATLPNETWTVATGWASRITRIADG